MSKVLEFLNGLEIKTIFNIGFIIAIVVADLYIWQLLGLNGGLNEKIDLYETQIKEKDEQIASDNKKIKELDRKTIKLGKLLKGYNKKYDSIKKGTSMDDAINKYRSQ